MTPIEKTALGKIEWWKVAVWFGLSLALWGACALLTPGCASLSPAQRHSLLEHAEAMTCVILNAALPDARAVAIACNLAPEFIPEIEKFMSAQAAADRIRTAKK